MPLNQLPSVTNTLPLHWKYVSEGGATIVFSYIGPPDPQLDGMVLRLRKCRLGQPFYNKDDILPVNEEPDDATIEFQSRCMERLIPSEHLPRLVSIRLSEPWLRAFAEVHNVERPVERSEVDEIDLSRTKGVLATDLIGTQGLAVELKPKWGFLPSTTHLSSATRPIKSRTCRFCMHVHLKTLQGEFEDISVGYCPLDLYSGDPIRIRSALENLWDVWMNSNGTINNLKVFVAGKVIRPNTIYELKAEILGRDSDDVDPTFLRDKFITSLLPLLTDTPVLRILGRLQRTLDVLDIEGLSTLWHRTLVSYSDPTADPEIPLSPVGQTSSLFESPDPTIDDWSSFIGRYLSETSHTNPLANGQEVKDTMNHDEPLTSNLRYYLMAYLLSATFKDCSVIVKPVLQAGVEQKGTVTVIDLDPKGMGRLKKWEKLDMDIVQSYSSLDEGSRKLCVDAFGDNGVN